MLRLPSRQLLRCLRGNLGVGEEVLGSNAIIVTTCFSTFSTPTSPFVKPTYLFVQHGGANRKQAFSSEQILDDLKVEEKAPENNNESPVESQTETFEQKAVTLTGLLELSQRKKLHHKTALYFVLNMAKLKKAGEVKEADYKAGLHAVLQQLEGGQVKDMQPLALLSCLKGLAELGVDDNHAAVKNLENSLVWLSRGCPIKELTMMLSFSISRKKTDSQKVLFSEVCKALERRWVEIKGASALVVQAPSDNFWVLLSKAHFNTGSGKDTHKPLLLTEITDGKIFCGLLRYSDQFSPQFLAKLEDRLAELAEDFPPSDLTAILKALAVSKRRNVPLLKAITFYLTKHRGLLDVKQLADALYSLNRLSFKDPVALEKICSELEMKVSNTGEEGGAVLRSVLTSLGQLRYLSTGLTDAICSWYQAREKVEERDMVTLLVTLSNLNYKSPKHTEMLQKFAMSLEPGQFRHLNRYEIVWLDVVWAMVALDLANHSHLDSVLNSSFHNLLLYSGENKNLGASIKLLNINAAAKLLHSDYKGPVLNVEEDPLLRDLKISPGLAKVQLRQKVLEAFASIAPTFVESACKSTISTWPPVRSAHIPRFSMEQSSPSIVITEMQVPSSAARTAISCCQVAPRPTRRTHRQTGDMNMV